MARYNDMSREDQRREERRQYERDVYYDVWRSGRDPERIDPERVQDHYYQGDPAESAAAHEVRIQQQAKQTSRDEAAYSEECERQRHEEYLNSQQPDSPPSQ